MIRSALMLLAYSSLLFAHEFEGTWNTACTKESQGYSMGTIIIDQSNAQVRFGYFDDANCTKMGAKGRLVGTFIFPSRLEYGDTVKFDLTYKESGVTMTTSKMATLANMMGVCDYSDWKVNVEKDVFGRMCFDKQMPKKGDVMYNILGLNDAGQLLIGKLSDELDGSTQDKRPTEFDTKRPLTKQSSY